MTNYQPGDLVHWGGGLWEVVETSLPDAIITQSTSGGHSTYKTVLTDDLTLAERQQEYSAATVKAAQAAADAHNAYMEYVKTLGNAVLEGTLTPEQEAKLEAMNEACNRAQAYLMVCTTVDLGMELKS